MVKVTSALSKQAQLHFDRKFRPIKKLKKDLDAIFSLFIRTRDNWTCQRCGKKYTPPTRALQCSHFWKRGDMGTRFSEDNCVALCYGCHRLWEGDKQDSGDYAALMRRKLGGQRFKMMEFAARSPLKFSAGDYIYMIAKFKQMLRDEEKKFQVAGVYVLPRGEGGKEISDLTGLL